MSSNSIVEHTSTTMDSLLTRLKCVEEKAKKRSRPDTLPTQSQSYRLPVWGDELRCMPNELLRSALFNAKNRNQARRYLENAEIAVIGESVRIVYTGKELRQTDELVWLQLIHLAQCVPLGCPIEFTAYSMVQSLRLTQSKPSQQHVERLLDSLRRMQASSLLISSRRLGRTVSLSMIPKFEWEDMATSTRLPKWRAWIAPELVELFGNMHFTRVEWTQRLALPTGLATWMHGYFSSHRDPYPVKLSTLQAGAGCTTESLSRFRQLVAKALNELREVGFLKHAEIRGEKVYVDRR